MLAGEAVVAIWNGIAPEGRAEFYAWHLAEHIPERVGIPGFRRGRRYISADAATRPEFFTLYEVETMQVLQGADYLARLNAPTPWTKATTAHFRDTSRMLAGVRGSFGPGMGGFALTLRGGEAMGEAEAAVVDAVVRASRAPRVTGAHVAVADRATSCLATAESAGRADILAPPAWLAMVEATDAEALADVLPPPELHAAGLRGDIARGVYRLEHCRGGTAFSG
jgi:hypothetical protein